MPPASTASSSTRTRGGSASAWTTDGFGMGGLGGSYGGASTRGGYAIAFVTGTMGTHERVETLENALRGCLGLPRDLSHAFRSSLGAGHADRIRVANAVLVLEQASPASAGWRRAVSRDASSKRLPDLGGKAIGHRLDIAPAARAPPPSGPRRHRGRRGLQALDALVPIPPRSSHGTGGSSGASTPDPAAIAVIERLEPVETVHGERRDVAVESMLAKQRAGVPELEMRRPRVHQRRRRRVDRATPAMQPAGDRHRCSRPLANLGAVNRIAPQPPQARRRRRRFSRSTPARGSNTAMRPESHARPSPAGSCRTRRSPARRTPLPSVRSATRSTPSTHHATRRLCSAPAPPTRNTRWRGSARRASRRGVQGVMPPSYRSTMRRAGRRQRAVEDSRMREGRRRAGAQHRTGQLG